MQNTRDKFLYKNHTVGTKQVKLLTIGCCYELFKFNTLKEFAGFVYNPYIKSGDMELQISSSSKYI